MRINTVKGTIMKLVIIGLSAVLLTGCATRDQMYYDASKAISKDATVASSACFASVTEIAKGGDNTAKTAAIALAEKCKVEPSRVEAPKRNIFGW